MQGVISLGEALIDFIPLDVDNMSYQKSPGGAPANVAVGIARLGGKSTFIGKVGDDLLGRFLEGTLKENGVDVQYLRFTDKARTGVTFVTLEASGERHFSFYIDPSADRFLHENDIPHALFKEHKILHVGSISMISEPANKATIKAVQLAKKAGMLLSYDPNLRLGLWNSAEQAKETIHSLLPQADLLKVSEEELQFITGEAELEKGYQALGEYDIPLLLVTRGSEGSHYFFKGVTSHMPPMAVDAIDTTGAGDAFVSAMLYLLNESDQSLEEMPPKNIEAMIRFASISGGLAVSSKGAMSALPTLEKIQSLL